ncbi:hypothetical protein ACFFRR_007130 [Megaselia abdita]
MFAKVIGILAIAALSSAAKVPVTIYYESLCPDSQAFIANQVYPVFKTELKDFIELTWVPFGKTTFETRGSDVMFQCHHGENECYGNKVHACALQHIQANSYQNEFTKTSLTVDFITCLMRAGKNFPDNVYPGKRCAVESHINNWENIAQCANSTDGSQLLKSQGEKTFEFMNPLTSVPTVVFKMAFNAEDQSRAMNDFQGVLCKYISEPKPRTCTINGAGSHFTIFTPILILAAFFLARFF